MRYGDALALARRGEQLASALDARADEPADPVSLSRAAVRELAAQLQLLAGAVRDAHPAEPAETSLE